MLTLRQILESNNNDELYQMGYNAFNNGIEDTPGLDSNFEEYVEYIQKNFKGKIETFGHIIKGLKQSWINGYKQASKDAGNKPFRMKGSSQSSAAYLLGAHKRRRDIERNKNKDK